MNNIETAAAPAFVADESIYDVCESRAEEPSEMESGSVLWAGLRLWLIRPN